MGLLKPDFYRSLLIGFLLGTAAMGISVTVEAHAGGTSPISLIAR